MEDNLNLDDVWTAMQTETLNGVPLSDVIGGGDPKKIAHAIVDAMEEVCPLRPGMTILDVGCGCGRIAAALAERHPTLSYVGIDIVPGLIDFARRKITSRARTFRFFIRDEKNESYVHYDDEVGQTRFKRISNVVQDATIDVAIAISLFTHLDFPEASSLASEISASLKPDGRFFMTCFIWDDEAQKAAKSRPEIHSAFTFEHKSPSGVLAIEKLNIPTYAVAYPPEHLSALAESCGLNVNRLRRGAWVGYARQAIFQDEAVLCRG